MEEKSIGGGKVGLARAEELIDEDKLEEAQAVLDGLDGKDGKWHYVQARLYIKKNWLNEARKQLEIAIKLEPGNAQYIEAYDHLKYRAEEEEKKAPEKRGAGSKEDSRAFWAECCCESCAFGCCEGLCEAGCDGCG